MDAAHPDQQFGQVSEAEPIDTDGALLERNPTWMTLYQAHLEGRDIPDDDASVEKNAHKFKLYVLVNGKLY